MESCIHVTQGMKAQNSLRNVFSWRQTARYNRASPQGKDCSLRLHAWLPQANIASTATADGWHQILQINKQASIHACINEQSFFWCYCGGDFCVTSMLRWRDEGWPQVCPYCKSAKLSFSYKRKRTQFVTLSSNPDFWVPCRSSTFVRTQACFTKPELRDPVMRIDKCYYQLMHMYLESHSPVSSVLRHLARFHGWEGSPNGTVIRMALLNWGINYSLDRHSKPHLFAVTGTVSER